MSAEYITTENFNKSGERRGTIKLVPDLDYRKKYPKAFSYLGFVDIEVANKEGNEITLERVEIGKLQFLINKAWQDIEANTPEDFEHR